MIGALILAIGVLYAGIVLALAPYRGFWSGDAGVKLWQMEAWIANRWRTPWASYAEVNVPFDLDHRLAPLKSPFALWAGDRVLTIYTLPYIFVSSLLLAGGGRLALYTPPLVAGVGALILAGRVGRRTSVRVAFLCVLVLGLATSWLFYSVTFWGHTVASLLIWGALMLLFPSSESPASRCWVKGIASGLCLGGAVAARPEAGVCIVALVAVMAFCRSAWRSLVWLMVGLGAMGLAGGGYQVVVLGQGAGGQVAMNFAPGAFGTALWSAGRLFELSQIVVESLDLGVVVILSSSALIFGLAHLYRRLRPDEGQRFGLVVECTGLVLAAVGWTVLVLRDHQPIDLLRGAPAIGLLFLGWAERTEIMGPQRMLRRRLLAWCVLVIVLSVILGRQSGGWQWGPRYLLPVSGPLVFLAVEWWERLDRGAGSRLNRYALRLALAALVVAGVVTQGMGVAKLWKVRAGNDALARVLLRAPSEVVIVTDIWFVPQSAPEVYGQVPFLMVRTAQGWGELEGRLQDRGIERVRLIRLTHFETPLAGHISARWRSVEDTSIVVPGIPSLVVVDYVPREPQ